MACNLNNNLMLINLVLAMVLALAFGFTATWQPSVTEFSFAWYLWFRLPENEATLATLLSRQQSGRGTVVRVTV